MRETKTDFASVNYNLSKKRFSEFRKNDEEILERAQTPKHTLEEQKKYSEDMEEYLYVIPRR